MHWRHFLLILMGQCSLFLCQHYEYYFIKEPKTWDEAQSYCRETYTDLATVPDVTHMERLYTKSTENQGKAWIGLYSISGKENRSWHWSLPGVEIYDEEMKWIKWRDAESESGVAYLMNCAAIESSGGLVNVGCADSRAFICYNEQNTSLNFIETPKLWRDAQSFCRECHTDLASGVKQLRESVSNFSNKLPLWIGLFRDTWRWSDGSNSSFRVWESVYELPEETSKTDSCTRKCATTALNKPGKWSSDDCNKRNPFFCYNATGNNTIPSKPRESASLCSAMADKFILINGSKNWYNALNYCRTHHHDLVSITKPEEQELVKEKAKNANTSYVWLGLRYSCALDLWFWVSDRLVCYKNWANETITDRCDLSGTMETGGENKWFKKDDDDEFNFICSLW